MQSYTLTTPAEKWQAYLKANELAKAAEKQAKAAYSLLNLPETGKEWAAHFGLPEAKQGLESVSVVLVDGNGKPLAAGKLSVRHSEPREASDVWTAPRF